jgi:hypothetical protein
MSMGTRFNNFGTFVFGKFSHIDYCICRKSKLIMRLNESKKETQKLKCDKYTKFNYLSIVAVV